MGLDVSSVGNHEFDRGTEELRRLSAATDGTYTDDVVACPETLNGEPFVVGTDGCFGNGEGHDFHGAEFPYLAANVLDKATGEPMLPPYQVFDIPGGQKIALIGVVTETTPDIVDAAGDRRRDRSSTRPTPSTSGCRCCSAAASRRSACWSTRAARRTVPRPSTTTRLRPT